MQSPRSAARIAPTSEPGDFPERTRIVGSLPATTPNHQSPLSHAPPAQQSLPMPRVLPTLPISPTHSSSTADSSGKLRDFREGGHPSSTARTGIWLIHLQLSGTEHTRGWCCWEASPAKEIPVRESNRKRAGAACAKLRSFLAILPLRNLHFQTGWVVYYENLKGIKCSGQKSTDLYLSHF